MIFFCGLSFGLSVTYAVQFPNEIVIADAFVLQKYNKLLPSIPLSTLYHLWRVWVV